MRSRVPMPACLLWCMTQGGMAFRGGCGGPTLIRVASLPIPDVHPQLTASDSALKDANNYDVNRTLLPKMNSKLFDDLGLGGLTCPFPSWIILLRLSSQFTNHKLCKSSSSNDPKMALKKISNISTIAILLLSLCNAFAPSISPQGRAFVARTSRAMQSNQYFFADVQVPPTAQKEDIVPAPKVRQPAKKTLPKNNNQEGPFAPAVLALKEVLGTEALNKLRAKVISEHSNVIKGFVQTSDSEFGQSVLRLLFRVADKNANGELDREEFKEYLESLGFGFLKEKQVNGMFEKADIDHNGTIDMDEWMRSAPGTLKGNLIKLAKKNGHDLGFLA